MVIGLTLTFTVCDIISKTMTLSHTEGQECKHTHTATVNKVLLCPSEVDAEIYVLFLVININIGG